MGSCYIYHHNKIFMATTKTPIESAGDQTHIPTSEGESRTASARDISTPIKRKALDSPEGHSPRRESVHYVDNSDLRDRCSRGVQPQPPKPVPRFLVVESGIPDKPLTKCNIFTVGKWFEGVSSQLVGRFWKEGSIFIVDCPSAKVSDMLMRRNGSTFITLPIKVSAHRSRNTSKGVIWCPDLEGLPEEEILENLQNQGVAKVERCQRTKGGLKVPTHTLFLTFNKTTLPEHVTIVYQRIKVKLYVPKPLQCYKCYKFGHPSSKCKGKQVCGRCGYDDHVGACPHPPLCPNCKGEHAPNSKTCPKYKEEHLIKQVMVEKKISFKEAKLIAKKMEGSVPQGGRSFANAVSTGINTKNSAPLATSKKSTFKERAVQFGLELPEAIHAEALALARELREDMKKTKSDASVQFTAEQPTEEKQSKSQRRKAAKRRKLQASPGETPATATTVAGAKQAQRPASQNSQAKPGDTPTSAPKPAGAKQAQEPAEPTPQAEPGETSASASKPAEGSQDTSIVTEEATSAESGTAEEEQSPETAPNPSEAMDAFDQTSGSEPEETSASAPQAAEGGVEIVDLPESEGIEGSGSVPSSPFLDLAGGDFISPKKKKRWRKKAERDPIFQSLSRSLFEDPESF